jgi:PAS domain S-box-containing protein
MSEKPTYQELQQRVKELEKEVSRCKLVENELRVSEEKFKKIFDNANIIIWGCYADGKIKIFNKEAERVMGYSQEEALGMINMSLHPPDEREEILEKFKRHKEGVLKKDLELGIYTKDGKRLEVLLAQATFKDAAGEDFYVALMQDITKRKQAEENIRFLSSMVEQSSEGMAIANLGGVLLFVNQAWARMHGYESTDKLIGKHLSIFHNQEQLEKEVKPFNDKVMKSGSHMGEVGHICNDGTPFPTLMTTTLLKDEQEKPFAFAGIAKDITDRKRVEEELAKHRYHLEELVTERTRELEELNKQLMQEIYERKQAEERLKKSEEKFRNLVESSPMGMHMYSLEPDNRLVFIGANSAADNILGVDNKQFIGKTIEEAFPPLIHTDVPERYRQACTSGKSWQTEQIEYKDKRIKGAFEVTAFQTAPGMMAAMFFDITERRITEEKLRDYQEKLRSLATELSLTEERERKRIATNLHDYIGQNLAICKMKLGELQKKASSADVAGDLGKIKEIVEQANHYARSLMFELSPPVLYELGLKSALEWLIERVGNQYGISISLEEDNNAKPLTDEILILLFRAVRELLVNVVKHGQTQKAAVSICREGNNIRVDIEDNGVGFDTSKIGVYGEGTGGFGLFNIRERLDYVGGRLLIKSQPGKGTCVTLLAPLKRDGDVVDEDVG